MLDFKSLLQNSTERRELPQQFGIKQTIVRGG
jgi:hypothetical protein